MPTPACSAPSPTAIRWALASSFISRATDRTVTPKSSASAARVASHQPPVMARSSSNRYSSRAVGLRVSLRIAAERARKRGGCVYASRETSGIIGLIAAVLPDTVVFPWSAASGTGPPGAARQKQIILPHLQASIASAAATISSGSCLRYFRTSCAPSTACFGVSSSRSAKLCPICTSIRENPTPFKLRA